MAEDQSTGKRILGAAEVKRSLVRIAHEVVERNRGVDDVILLGIPSGGVPLARRLGEALSIALAEDAALTGSQPANAAVPVGTLDITMFRDDLGRHPIRVPQPTFIPGDTLEGRTVILVDDVLYSGRTIAPLLTPWARSGAREPSSSPSWWIGGIANCRSAPTTSVRTCRPPAPRRSSSR